MKCCLFTRPLPLCKPFKTLDFTAAVKSKQIFSILALFQSSGALVGLAGAPEVTLFTEEVDYINANEWLLKNCYEIQCSGLPRLFLRACSLLSGNSFIYEHPMTLTPMCETYTSQCPSVSDWVFFLSSVLPSNPYLFIRRY